MTGDTLHKENTIKEIKSLFRKRIKEAGQLSLGLDTEESEEFKALKSFLKEKPEPKVPVCMKDIIRLFSSRTSQDTQWRIVFYLAKLFLDGHIYLVSENRDISGMEALKYFIREKNWSKLQIISQKTTEQLVPDRTRKMAEALFGEVISKTRDDLASFIQGNLRGWNKILNRCNEKTGIGKFPGKKMIFESRAVITKLLAIGESSEFIVNFEADGEKLFRISEELKSLDQFYSKHLDTWKNLFHAMENLKPNRPFLENFQTIQQKIGRMEYILSSPTPYEMIDEIDRLIAEVNEANRNIVEKYRNDAVDHIDKYLTHLTELLDMNSIPAEPRNKILHPLHRLKKKLHSEFYIPGIDSIIEEARDHYDESVDKTET